VKREQKNIQLTTTNYDYFLWDGLQLMKLIHPKVVMSAFEIGTLVHVWLCHHPHAMFFSSVEMLDKTLSVLYVPL